MHRQLLCGCRFPLRGHRRGALPVLAVALVLLLHSGLPLLAEPTATPTPEPAPELIPYLEQTMTEVHRLRVGGGEPFRPDAVVVTGPADPELAVEGGKTHSDIFPWALVETGNGRKITMLSPFNLLATWKGDQWDSSSVPRFDAINRAEQFAHIMVWNEGAFFSAGGAFESGVGKTRSEAARFDQDYSLTFMGILSEARTNAASPSDGELHVAGMRSESLAAMDYPDGVPPYDVVRVIPEGGLAPPEDYLMVSPLTRLWTVMDLQGAEALMTPGRRLPAVEDDGGWPSPDDAENRPRAAGVTEDGKLTDNVNLHNMNYHESEAWELSPAVIWRMAAAMGIVDLTSEDSPEIDRAIGGRGVVRTTREDSYVAGTHAIGVFGSAAAANPLFSTLPMRIEEGMLDLSPSGEPDDLDLSSSGEPDYVDDLYSQTKLSRDISENRIDQLVGIEVDGGVHPPGEEGVMSKVGVWASDPRLGEAGGAPLLSVEAYPGPLSGALGDGTSRLSLERYAGLIARGNFTVMGPANPRPALDGPGGLLSAPTIPTTEEFDSRDAKRVDRHRALPGTSSDGTSDKLILGDRSRVRGRLRTAYIRDVLHLVPRPEPPTIGTLDFGMAKNEMAVMLYFDSRHNRIRMGVPRDLVVGHPTGSGHPDIEWVSLEVEEPVGGVYDQVGTETIPPTGITTAALAHSGYDPFLRPRIRAAVISGTQVALRVENVSHVEAATGVTGLELLDPQLYVRNAGWGADREGRSEWKSLAEMPAAVLDRHRSVTSGASALFVVDLPTDIVTDSAADVAILDVLMVVPGTGNVDSGAVAGDRIMFSPNGSLSFPPTYPQHPEDLGQEPGSPCEGLMIAREAIRSRLLGKPSLLSDDLELLAFVLSYSIDDPVRELLIGNGEIDSSTLIKIRDEIADLGCQGDTTTTSSWGDPDPMTMPFPPMPLTNETQY